VPSSIYRRGHENEHLVLEHVDGVAVVLGQRMDGHPAKTNTVATEAYHHAICRREVTPPRALPVRVTADQ
jgi:hypothetical protein